MSGVSSRRLCDLCALFVLAALFLSGCKKNSTTETVHGHVLYKGEALKSAGINFFPTSGRPVTTAVTDGEYAAELPRGDYVVTITVGSELPPGYKEGDPPPPPPKIVLPAQYSTRAQSTLKATVKPGQSEAIDFDLK